MAMEALVAVETMLLVLLMLLVAGLLRSHAEILRRLEAKTGSGADSARVGGWVDEGLPRARPGATPAFDVAGVTLAGEPVKVSVAPARSNTLLAFLSSGCPSCVGFWEGLADPKLRPDIPGGARIVAVTKDPAFESPARLRQLAPRDVPVVMSSAAWEAYGVQGSPYFIYVDGPGGGIVGEGTATAWPQVASLIRDAFDDAALASPASTRRRSADRAERAESALAAAGIGPGHPSLYGLDTSRSSPVQGPGGASATPGS